MNFFENNLRKMFENSEVIDNPYFCGNCMIGRLDEDVRIKVRFTTQGVSDSYPALAVKILNRTEGEVDSQCFNFSSILGTKGGNTNRGVHAWTYNGETDWYRYHPTLSDMDKIAGAVESYAAMFQAEDMNMTM